MDNDQVGPAVNAAREALRAHFRAKRIDDTKTVVQEWRDEHVYPFAGDPLDAVEMAEQALFTFVAGSAAEAGNCSEDPKAEGLSIQTRRVAVAREPAAGEVTMRRV